MRRIGGGLAFHVAPDAERPEGPHAAVRKRRRALIEACRLGCTGRDGLDQHDREGQWRKRERQGRADHPAAADGDVAGRRVAGRLAHAVRMTRSTSSGVRGRPIGQHLAATRRDRDVVLDAHADVPPAARHALAARRDVDARLDGQAHARFEHAPFVADLVVADVVYVHARASDRYGA